jgi:hypothetical protein
MNHDIDERLREDGEQWRASLPALADPDVMLGEPPARRPHRALAIALAAAVVVVVAGVAVAVRLASASPDRDQPHPAAPNPGTALCQSGFQAGPSKFIAGKGGQNLQVTLTYQGAAPCRVSAYGPYVDLQDAANDVLGFGGHSTMEAHSPDYLDVVLGDKLAITMGPWLDYSCNGPVPHVATAILHMGGDSDRTGQGVRVDVPAGDLPPCEPGYRVAQPSVFVNYPTLTPGGPNRYPASYGSVPQNAAELPTTETQRSGTPHREDWTLLAIDQGGRRITIRYIIGACDRLDYVKVESTGSTVTLTLIVRSNQTECIAIGLETTGYITLPEPLGRRALLHHTK